MTIRLPLALAILCLLAPPTTLGAQAPIDFNRQIRPILAGRCFKCHGPDEAARESGLRLDLRQQAAGEADSGLPAIVPGKAAQSELIAHIAADDEDVRMPPADQSDRLTDEEISLLRRWVEMGAPYAQHWSFTKPVRPPLPEVSDPAWPRNGIDHFVMARLERRGLSPSPEADRYTLARRLWLDLTGLPPTIEQVDRFVGDGRPDAYQRLIDQLLDSPRYGERLARVWLDLARYADSQGYAQDSERTIWRYRDWVIRAINDNMPFDKFTIQQIAGDLLPEPTTDQLIATAFHRNTMTNSEGGTDDEEFRVAAVVDRVNTTMQVWMGLTMGCAQCHDHKYDPISQEEYYRFFAFFNNTEDADQPDERPKLATYTPQQQQQRAELEKQVAAVKLEMARQASSGEPAPPERSGPLATRFVRIELPGRQRFLSLAEVQAFVSDKNVAISGTATQSSTDFDGPPRLAIDGDTGGHYFDAKSTTHTKQEDNPWWEVDLGQAATIGRVVVWNRTDSPGIGRRLDGFRLALLGSDRQPLWVKTIAQAPEESAALEVPAAADALDEAELSGLADYLRGNSPHLQRLQAELAALEKKLKAVKPITTPIMRRLPADKRRKTHVLVRGNFLNNAAEVTAGVPAAFHALPQEAAEDRLAMARWLVHPDNPLTARVTVNRYWELLFGQGLVETSEDFGTQGRLPSHPDLLDWLATELVRMDWDVKRLLKLIVTSATYRQSSGVTPELLEADLYNRWLARGPRFRLSAEMVRDQALAIGGLLSRKMLGPSVRPPRPKLGLKAAFGGSTDWDPSQGQDRYRRGLYTTWRRTTPYPSLTTFDAPSREVCTIRRVRTNTPLQALVTLNDPVYIEAAQALARRIMTDGGSGLQQRATYGFRLCLARPPKRAERDRLLGLYDRALDRYRTTPQLARPMATDPLGPAPESLDIEELAAWTVLANVLLNLDELLMKR